MLDRVFTQTLTPWVKFCRPYRGWWDLHRESVGQDSRLRKNSFNCHPEEPSATKDLRSSLKIQLPRFFAKFTLSAANGLRMTAFKAFSAAC